jgi:hypothetical protein
VLGRDSLGGCHPGHRGAVADATEGGSTAMTGTTPGVGVGGPGLTGEWGLWAVGCGLWAVGCGLWAVGCGLMGDCLSQQPLSHCLCLMLPLSHCLSLTVSLSLPLSDSLPLSHCLSPTASQALSSYCPLAFWSPDQNIAHRVSGKDGEGGELEAARQQLG